MMKPKLEQVQSINIADIKRSICQALELSPENPPLTINDKEAASVLEVKPGTLSVWRSTGRYPLPYVKVGRSVRYRLDDLAQFIASRTQTHTGEAAQ